LPFIIGRCQHASKEATKSLDFEVHGHRAEFPNVRGSKGDSRLQIKGECHCKERKASFEIGLATQVEEYAFLKSQGR
jgi:hypothetical protein